jgi:hypothetical protein
MPTGALACTALGLDVGLRESVAILNEGSESVMPPRRHRRFQHHYDRIAYRQRWGIEGFFAKLKKWQRIAIRYENSQRPSSRSSKSPLSCLGSND